MKIIILDRDGVINQDSVNYIKSPNEWIPIPNSLEAIARLNQHSFKVIIATNQSGIGRGLFDIETMNTVLQWTLPQMSASFICLRTLSCIFPQCFSM